MKIMDLQLSIGQTSTTQNDNFAINYTRSLATNLSNSIQTASGGSIAIPSGICSIFNDPSFNCSAQPLVQQTFTLSTALIGKNTDLNPTKSSMTSLSFYKNTNPLAVSNQNSNPIVLTIPRSSSAPQTISFQQVNVSNSTALNALNQLTTFSLALNTSVASVHFNLKPSSTRVGFLMVLKYGKLPVLNTRSQTYDKFKIACPQYNLITDSNNDTFYLLFSNMSSNVINALFVGIGVRQLTVSEYMLYCVNGTNATSAPVLTSDSDFLNLTAIFSVRSYSSGCYFLNRTSGFWLWGGVDVLESTSIAQTVCATTHLTDFAGGLVAMPAPINFDYVFANASFDKNKTIYLTAIIIISLYLIMATVCRYVDYRNSLRSRVYLLKDNHPDHLYFYELIISTGNRANSDTKSRVNLLAVAFFIYLLNKIDLKLLFFFIYKRYSSQF
jgi:hypothetical protein